MGFFYTTIVSLFLTFETGSIDEGITIDEVAKEDAEAECLFKAEEGTFEAPYFVSARRNDLFWIRKIEDLDENKIRLSDQLDLDYSCQHFCQFDEGRLEYRRGFISGMPGVKWPNGKTIKPDAEKVSKMGARFVELLKANWWRLVSASFDEESEKVVALWTEEELEDKRFRDVKIYFHQHMTLSFYYLGVDKEGRFLVELSPLPRAASLKVYDQRRKILSESFEANMIAEEYCSTDRDASLLELELPEVRDFRRQPFYD